MRRKTRKLISILLAGVLAVCCLAGCSSGDDKKGEEKTRAMGRYLETDIPMPENIFTAYSIVQTEEGSFLMSTVDREGKGSVWRLQEDESSWEKVYDVDAETAKEGEYTKPYVSSMALSPKGDALLNISVTNEDDTDWIDKYYYLDASGAMTEVPYEPESYTYYMQSDDEGNFYMAHGDSSVRRVDVKTGEAEVIVDGSAKSQMYGIAGNTLYSASEDGTVTPYDLDKGEPLPQDEGLADALKQSGLKLAMFSTSAMPLLFAGGGEDSLFFCSNAGIHHHVKNGSATEQIVDGALTSLSSPETELKAMKVTSDESIYVLAQKGDGSAALMKYTYSPDTPAVPETELKAYSLHENPELQQAIALYQKENPEVYITLETGVTEENGVTVSDALRTLSTEIMAGNGPDFMLMDGMPIDSYVEKGILEEISDIVEEADASEGLFTNVTSAFEEEGKMYAVPLRFDMPVAQGPEKSLEKIKDLTSLVDEAIRLKEENPDKSVINKDLDGDTLARQLYDTCSAAWVREDGTIHEENLQEFYSQLKRLYDIDERKGEEFNYGTAKGGIESTISLGTLGMYADKSNINFGNLKSVTDLVMLTTTQTDREGISYKTLNGQTEKAFLPESIAGINSKSRRIEEARDFLAFLLRKTAQLSNQGNGLPVNRQSCEELIMEGDLGGYTFGSGTAGGDDFIWITLKSPTETDYKEYLAMVESLQTPALSNEVIWQAVLEQVNDCMTGAVTVEDTVKKVVEKVNLYLAEG